MQFSNKKILQITYPVLISLLVQQIIGLTDTAYLGRVGEIELGASALASTYYLAIYMLGFGFSIGAQILIARRNGEGRLNKIGPIFMQGVLFLLQVAVVVFVLSKMFSSHLMHMLIQSEDVFRATMSYMDWRVYGFFFSFVAAMFRAFYVGITRTRVLTYNSIVMVMTNIVLNYVLIFGKFGFPEMGIAGAALASSISEAVSMVYLIIYTRREIDYKRYRLFHFVGVKIRLLFKILNVSLWTMIQSFISTSAWLIFFVAVEHLGERSLAVTNIVRSISSTLFMFVSAFASTGSSLVSNMIGNGQQDQVMRLCRRIIMICYCFVLPLTLIIAILPTDILRIYTDNTDLIADSVNALWIMLGSYVICVPGFVYFMAVSGTGNARTALLIEIVSLVVYIGFILYLIGLGDVNVAIYWFADSVYYVMVLLSFFYLWKGNWRKIRI